MAELIFHEDTHEYQVESEFIPSVSEILQDCGISDYSSVPDEILAKAAERGSHVHLATALYDYGKLDMSTVKLEWRDYVKAWVQFTNEYNPEWLVIEQPIYSKKYQFATTPDRIAYINGKLCDIEIKTTFKFMKSTAIQTAAHCICYNEDKKVADKIKKRYCVLLNKKGTYKFIEMNDKSDERVFLGALTVFNWKKENK